MDYEGKKRANGHNVVGSYLPNAWGLYDMHGNVQEWCLDWWYYFDNDPVTEPYGMFSGVFHVARGGSWGDDARYCRSAYRTDYIPDYGYYDRGFRVALVQNVFLAA